MKENLCIGSLLYNVSATTSLIVSDVGGWVGQMFSYHHYDDQNPARPLQDSVSTQMLRMCSLCTPLGNQEEKLL